MEEEINPNQTKLLFYSTFHNLLNEVYEEEADEEYESKLDEMKIALFKLEKDEKRKTLEGVLLAKAKAKHLMAKPQRLLHDHDDFYVAVDIQTNTYYVCYRNLLMVDLDYYKDSEKINFDDPDYESRTKKREQELIDKIDDYALARDLRFKIYRSRNGIHAFLVSKEADYTYNPDLKIMLDLDCDFGYIVYSSIRGWSVRINRKEKEYEMKYTYIQDAGDVRELPHLVQLVDLHLNLLDTFKGVDPSSMFGN